MNKFIRTMIVVCVVGALCLIADSASAQMNMPPQGGMPNYFGPESNWANSPIIPKFVDSLPGLNAAGANNLGQYIPVAVPDTASYPGSDYYVIELGEYTEKMHSNLNPTTLRGYRQTNATDPTVNTFHYLGPLIVAQKNRPVRIKFINNLPTGAGGNLFLPVDTTIMGAGMGPLMMNTTPGYPMNYTENRATIHLHGGLTPWISDGTQHQWITPAGELTDYPKGVSVQNVPDMPDPGAGSLTFYYSNEQSARLMFYHDHAFGITRLNVYAGEAAGYLLTDAVEQDLITRGILPGVGIPLIIQDKTFIDTTDMNPDPAMYHPSILMNDPTWPFAVNPALNNLWMPHVYMPNQNPNVFDGVNPLGRWDYGPWIWPPFPTDHAPFTFPDGSVYPYEFDGLDDQVPNLPDISMGMETFNDTPVINGTAYPYLVVEPKTYRFRILNAANDRFFNLQLLQADPTAPTEVQMVNFDNLSPWPAGWPKPDLRDGGIPNPTLRGPQMIQIGTEGGFLPTPVVWDNIPIGWDTNPKSMTVGNILEHNLFLGSAERADVIVDFSAFAGKTLILYNDAPAAVPARDPRYDYYTGNADLTAEGGAPSTQAGFGPNIRTLMQIRVANTTPAAPYNVAALNAEFKSTPTTQGVFARGQDPILVPQAAYNDAYGLSGVGADTFPSGNTAYERIQNMSLTFNPLDLTQPNKLSPTALTLANQPKAIAEEFNTDWGRMAGYMGVELKFTNGMNQTTIFYRLSDPVTEVLNDSVTVSPVTGGDGTQLWKITHNGVDTHAIHFHLFNVQLVNRVDWAGVVKKPELNELGWKETVRMNPLEDCIVALRPVAGKYPWGQPDSIRTLDPTMPEGATGTFFRNIDPSGNPVTVVNNLYNFGWEYVWHCHILSHEEMDMMRPMQFNVARALPIAPVLSGAQSGTQVNLSWIDGTPAAASLGNPANEIGFRIERSDNGGAFAQIGKALANETAFVDSAITNGNGYSYRVIAYNASGDAISNVVNVAFGILPPAAPTLLVATRPALGVAPIKVDLAWTDNASNESGFYIERALGGGAFAQIQQVGANVTTWTDLTVAPSTAYRYRVRAYNGAGNSAYTNIASITTRPNTLPAAPTNVRISVRGATYLIVAWSDNSTNNTSFEIQRSSTATGPWTPVGTVGANVTSYRDNGLSRLTGYYYQVRAVNGFGSSAWVPVPPVFGVTRLF
jgi:FtsP/CotA-like multicopper oxidase with cupredoxin domain